MHDERRLPPGPRLPRAVQSVGMMRLRQRHDAFTRFWPDGLTAIEGARHCGGRDARQFGDVGHLQFSFVHGLK